MLDPAAQPQKGGGGCWAAEAVVVFLAAGALAFLANGLSPRGLKLNRNYFPSVTAPLPQPRSPALAPEAVIRAKLTEEGLQPADRALAETLFHDPRLDQNRVVFIDARNATEFGQGHIPGAHEFDPFHPEATLAEILPLCQNAEQILVYCTGGDCEDSQSAALYLKTAGIPGAKLFVYAGGITDWIKAGLPTEGATPPPAP